jgi:uncharacterized membrane protein YhaH (DUF805 family)
MQFQDAVRVVLQQKYATFDGRARRSEFWWFALFSFAVGVAASLLDSALGSGRLINGLVSLALLVPSLAVGARRLHDTGRSGWWQLIGIIPVIGWIVLIVWFVQDSQQDNQYGPNPKGPQLAYEAPPVA